MANSINEAAIKKLKLLITVVERPKAEFFLDVLSQFEVNFQMVMPGKGTANSDLVSILELNSQKAVIFSVVREDMVEPILKCIEEKFETIRNGKGIAFAGPMSSVIGVSMYQFLSNNQQKREG